MEHESLFSHYKYCELCKKPMPLSYDGELCHACAEYMLFSEVKEFIRANDVTEYDVAEEFGLPLRRVKQWIAEGRIEYKDEHLNSKIVGKCQNCGIPIYFGTLCPKCLKQANVSGHSAAHGSDSNRMRYLENPEKSK